MPEAWLVLPHAAIDDVAGMTLANAKLRARCVTARALGEDIVRLIRKQAAGIAVVTKPNVQPVAMKPG
jgi:hypothetical protein